MKQGALILVIDDEVQIRRFLKMSLEAYGYSVKEAENGEEGFRAVFDYHPDLIILDLELPDTNGLDLLKKIRLSSTIPVLVLSVKNDENDKLIFQPPMPTSDTPPETQSRISETQSEPRPVSGAPVESAPTQIQSPNELAAPIENTEQPMMQNEQAAP